MPESKPNRYQALISRIFHDHFTEGSTEFEFERSELNSNAKKLKIKLPDNLGDVIYSFRYRTPLPEDIVATAEQALLAKVRYNRLIDIFLGITTYSLQSHLRTTVSKMGQIEIDEVYVGVNRNGQQFVVPVQAKSGTDKLATIQTLQDIACCAQKFPSLTCRPVSAQFMDDDVIALFELAVRGDGVKIAEERHYQLVPADSIQAEDLKTYANR